MPTPFVIRCVVALACLSMAVPTPGEFSVGMVIRDPVTLAAGDLDGLINLVGDGIRPASYLKHGGDFDAYCQILAVDGRAGKAFEAVVAHKANLTLPDGRRLLVTAAEGYKADPADLALVRKTNAGYVVEELIQSKMGYGATVSALKDPKYADMKIITPRDTFDGIAESIRRESIRKASLGRPLPPETAMLQKAIESGRLVGELPGGTALPAKDEIRAISRLRDLRLWNDLPLAPISAPGFVRGGLASHAAESMVASAGAKLIAAASAEETIHGAMVAKQEFESISTGGSRQVGRISGGVLLRLAQTTLAVDAGYASWLIATDFGRWQDGSVEVDEFLALSALRSLRIGLAAVALVDPEVFSKAGFIAALVLVSGLEYACDRLYDAARNDMRVALASIETEERYRMARDMLLEEW